MMITYLILAHRDLEHLRELVAALGGNRIFIHLDKKSAISRSAVLALCDNQNIYLIEEKSSINVHWGGFSQIQAMLLLIQVALPHMAPREKLMFLSGSDFPIRSYKEIQEKFSDNVEKEYLRYYPLDDRKKDVKRWRLYHRWDLRIFKKRGSILNRFNSLCLKILTILETFFRGAKKNPGYILMAGSNWFAISRECAENMLSFRNEEYDKFFKSMFAPDEVYFATLFAMSNYWNLNMDRGAYECNSHSSRLFQVRNLTYVDESLNKWLDMEDLERIQGSNFLFARKYDSELSLNLRNHLKDRLGY